VLALARPQVEGKRQVELRGLDLVVAMDVSKSMLVDDVEPTEDMAKRHDSTRLARARELAGAVIDELPGDRIAPVVFAGAAAHFPLTEDHLVATNFLSDLGPADLPAGSNLVEVFRVSRCLLRPDLYDDLGCSRIGRRGHGGDPLTGESLDPVKQPGSPASDSEEQRVARGKAILVFTDGGDPTPEALREVAMARELGIAVVLVGMGTRAGGLVHEIDALGRRTDRPKRGPGNTTITSKRDDEGMRALADAAGDEQRYVIASEHGEVDPEPVVAALRRVDRGVSMKKIDEMRDVFQPFLFAGLMLLVIEAAIGTRRRKVVVA
jgi:Ca-activated chloride channel family protein